MIFDLVVVRGKTVKGGTEISNYLKKLDGNYTVEINEENTLTSTKECRAAYFFKVDLIQKHTGSERYEIHNDFKAHLGITSTKDYTVTDWRNFIKQFQMYIFEKLDIVI